MNKYFTTELQNRSINGVPYENCQVVVGEQFTTGVIEGMIQAPEEYSNLSMIGLGYFPEDEHPFKALDELPVEPTEEPSLKEILEAVKENTAVSNEILFNSLFPSDEDVDI